MEIQESKQIQLIADIKDKIKAAADMSIFYR